MKGNMNDDGQQSRPNGLDSTGSGKTLLASGGVADFSGGGDKRDQDRFLASILGVYDDDSSISVELSQSNSWWISVVSMLCLVFGIGLFLYQLVDLLQGL